MNFQRKFRNSLILSAAASIVFAQPISAQGIPKCKKNDSRVAILSWSPDLNPNGTLKREPPTGEGLIVYIKASLDANNLDCVKNDTELFSLEHLSGVDRDLGGLAVNFPASSVQYVRGFCHISGYFLNKDVPGMHAGFIETYFEPIELQKIVLSNNFCMKK